MSQWIDLSGKWERITQLDQERQEQKKDYKSGLHLSKQSTWLIGLCGEYAVSSLCGQPVDEALKPQGDSGIDFRCDFGAVDVKSSTRLHDADLVLFPDQKHWADFYILVSVDVKRKRARICGWATLAEIRAGELHDYGYGHRLRLKEQCLHPGIVPSMEFFNEMQ
jgi:hypothetical protein